MSFDPIGKHFAFGTSHGKTVVTTVKELNKKIPLEVEKKEKSGLKKTTGLVWGAVEKMSKIVIKKSEPKIKHVTYADMVRNRNDIFKG